MMLCYIDLLKFISDCFHSENISERIHYMFIYSEF